MTAFHSSPVPLYLLLSTHHRASIQKQIELADGQSDRLLVLFAPQRREAPALEPFGIDAQARAVEVQHFGAHAITADEDVHLAALWLCGMPHSHCSVAGRDLWRERERS